MREIDLRGKFTLVAEGARGSLSKMLIARYSPEEDREPPERHLISVVEGVA